MSCGHSHYPRLPPVGDRSLTGRLADERALAIHLGDLQSGTALREVELARAHDVSRTIVRAALQRLEGQGLVEIVQNKGASVRRVSAQAARELIDLHGELLAAAARRAAGRAAQPVLTRMHEFVDMMDHLVEDGGTVREFQHLRVGFARLLLEAAGAVWAERLRMAAPVVPHHDGARADIEGGAAQEVVARATRSVMTAVAGGDVAAAGDAARALMELHAASVRAGSQSGEAAA